MSDFGLFIGIDYSGAQTPTSRLRELQVYVARPGSPVEKQHGPTISRNGKPMYWTRAEIAEWLIRLAQDGVRYIAGIGHAFSFPMSYFQRNRLSGWEHFLADFVRYWPTDEEHAYVDLIRDGMLVKYGLGPIPGGRTGRPTELRLCERWTSSRRCCVTGIPATAVRRTSRTSKPSRAGCPSVRATPYSPATSSRLSPCRNGEPRSVKGGSSA